MNILSIDTTSKFGLITISNDSKPLVHDVQPDETTHAATLIPRIERLLQNQGMKLSDIDGLGVAVGPGSFTGLRIGLSVVKGMAIGLNIKAVGFSSLEALAFNGRGRDGIIASVVDARRGEVYCSCYRFSDGLNFPSMIYDERAMLPVDFASELIELNEQVFIVGDGAMKYADIFDRSENNIDIGVDEMMFGSPIGMAALSFRQLSSSNADDLSELVPNYIRRSDAEIGFRGR